MLLRIYVHAKAKAQAMGYSLGCVLRSKRDNSQCSLVPDNSYKKWCTDREAPRAYTQPEGIGYLVRTVCRGRSNLKLNSQ